MGQFLRFAMLLIVLGAGAFIYMRQAQSASAAAGGNNPQGAVDIVGVKHDLMAVVRAERVHSALHGGFGSIEELRSSGDLSMERNNRGPFNYSVDLSASGFRVIATNSGPAGSSPRVISVDQDMQFSEQ